MLFWDHCAKVMFLVVLKLLRGTHRRCTWGKIISSRNKTRRWRYWAKSGNHQCCCCNLLLLREHTYSLSRLLLSWRAIVAFVASQTNDAPLDTKLRLHNALCTDKQELYRATCLSRASHLQPMNLSAILFQVSSLSDGLLLFGGARPISTVVSLKKIKCRSCFRGYSTT